MNDKQVVTFRCEMSKCLYSSDDYHIYAMHINRAQYPNIKTTDYGTVVIKGEMYPLDYCITYEVTAEEQRDKRGYAYQVINIKMDKPQSLHDMKVFLDEILTPSQSTTLWNAYPDIVSRVIENRLDDIDFSRLHRIGEATFERIKEKIIQNYVLVDLVAEFHGILSLSIIKKMYKKYSSVELVREKMRTEPYDCLCNLSGIGFKKADALLLDLEEQSKKNVENGKPPIIEFESNLRTSKQRCLACIQYLLKENQNSGHTKMGLIELKNECDKLVPACAHHFVECMKHESIHYDVSTKEAALRYVYETEKYIGARIQEGLAYNKKWHINLQKYRVTTDGITATDEQMEALRKLCEYQVSILNGPAGTGKTQTTNLIIQMLKDNCKTFVLMSPTGKAAKVLSEYTKEYASTIHRRLGFIPPDRWGYDENHPLYADVVIIDEFSMTDIFLFKHVLEAINWSSTKLLLIGDDSQLPSVSCGNLLYDMIQSKVVPCTTLSKVFRYSEGGLMTVATDVRNQKTYLKELPINHIEFYGQNKDYAFIHTESSNIIKNLTALYKKLLSQGYSPEEILVLTAYNKGDYGTVAINQHIQKIANKNYGNPDKCCQFGDQTYYIDDIVIQKVNNYNALCYEPYVEAAEELNGKGAEQYNVARTELIANGETGRIVGFVNGKVLIDFNGTLVLYGREDFEGVGLGYSISIHKSQGSSSRVVILLTPQNHIYMLNSNLIYVGLTRMKEKCFHLGSVKAVNLAVKKKENFKRQTFLQDILKGKCNG